MSLTYTRVSLNQGGGNTLASFYYLAGQMGGIPKFNFPAFNDAANHLRLNGFNIVNPAELDHEQVRRAAEESKTGDISDIEDHSSWEDCLRRDLKIVLNPNCKGVICLEGWEQSRGARLETYVASALGLPLLGYNSDEKAVDGFIHRETSLSVYGIPDGL